MGKDEIKTFNGEFIINANSKKIKKTTKINGQFTLCDKYILDAARFSLDLESTKTDEVFCADDCVCDINMTINCVGPELKPEIQLKSGSKVLLNTVTSTEVNIHE